MPQATVGAKRDCIVRRAKCRSGARGFNGVPVDLMKTNRLRPPHIAGLPFTKLSSLIY